MPQSKKQKLIAKYLEESMKNIDWYKSEVDKDADMFRNFFILSVSILVIGLIGVLIIIF